MRAPKNGISDKSTTKSRTTKSTGRRIKSADMPHDKTSFIIAIKQAIVKQSDRIDRLEAMRDQIMKINQIKNL
jgi:hypothetical protein